jgi:hypothetical protein
MTNTPFRFRRTLPGLAMLALVWAGSAAADGRTVFADRYLGPMAELSAEEQAWFRSHWQQMSPDEREAVRRKLRKEWRDTPPEQRHRQREELVDRIRDQGDTGNRPANNRGPERRGGYGNYGWGMPDGGYGQGYENRNWEYPDDGGRGRR